MSNSAAALIATGSLPQLAAALKSGETTAAELAQLSHVALARAQSAYNIAISIMEPDQLAAQSAAAQKLIQSTAAQPLAGIPYAIKDIFCTAGIKTSCGSKMLDNFVAPYNATAVAQLAAAGGVMVCKSNMDEFAMGSSTELSYYGAVRNPWDKTRVAGGSSGGSAAAVAARLVPYALGTDTGGSVRQPAAFCGVTGIKPTYGRVSRYGMIAYASSFDQAGIFTVQAEDAAQVLQAISGADPKDSTSARREVPDYAKLVAATKAQVLTGLKIGLPQEFTAKELNPEIKTALTQALETLAGQGAEIVELSMPQLARAIPCYYTLTLAEASANLARYDGVRYGHRAAEAADIYELYIKSRAEGFGDEVKRRILLGTYVLTSGYYDAYYLKAQKVRRLIRNEFSAALNKVDVIAGPVTPTPAFKLGEKNDPVSMYLQDIYTVPANLAGLPAMSVPMGLVNNLPVGMQLLGNYFAEAQLLAVAAAYQELTDWHKQVPPAFAAAAAQ